MISLSPGSYISRKIIIPVSLTMRQWLSIPARLREFAFYLAGCADGHILQAFQKTCESYADGRMTRSEGRVSLKDWLKSYGYSPPDEFKDSIFDLSSTIRIELELETNVRMARGWMQYCQLLRDPNVVGQQLFRLYERYFPRNWKKRWLKASALCFFRGVSLRGASAATLLSPVWRRLSIFGFPYPPFDFYSGMSTQPILIREKLSHLMLGQDSPQNRSIAYSQMMRDSLDVADHRSLLTIVRKLSSQRKAGEDDLLVKTATHILREEKAQGRWS